MIAFLVNPVSGNGRGAKIWRRVEERLRSENIPYQVRFSGGPGEGVHLGEELALNKSCLALVAVGGDGTVNEAVSGIHRARAKYTDPGRTDPLPPLGYIPAGSGNDFARGHGIPSDPLAALDRILACLESGRCIKSIDLLDVGGRIAASSVGCGLDGQVALTTNRSSYKRWLNRLGLGKLAYILSVVRTLLSYRPAGVLLRVDGREIQLEDVWLVAVCNIPFYGGGMKICPDALPDDGMVTVCTVSGISRFTLLRLFPLVFSGAHTKARGVRMFQGQTVEIIPNASLISHTDGELAGAGPLTVRVLPGALSVLIPDTAAASGGSRRPVEESSI